MKKLKHKIFIAMAVILTYAATATEQNCTCERHFEWLRKTFEENDAGFQNVIDRRGLATYDLHNQMMLERIRTAETLTECLELLNEWLAFFRREHIGIFKYDQTSLSEMSQMPPRYRIWDGADSFRLNNKDIDTTFIENYIRFRTIRVPFFEQLNETTLYFRIPSFWFAHKPAIDSIIATNRDKISQTENLIIDLRNNGGGNDATFQPLLPLLYTNPVRLTGIEFLSAPQNNQMFLDFATLPQWEGFFDEETKQWFKRGHEILQNRLGEFVNLFEEDVRIIQFDTVYEFPKNVGIIINEGVASTAEQFLLVARQSRKVKLFGVTTAGALDVSNMGFARSPCGELELGYGMSRTLRRGMAIDDIGLQPDFYLDKFIPQYRWVEFVNGILNE